MKNKHKYLRKNYYRRIALFLIPFLFAQACNKIKDDNIPVSEGMAEVYIEVKDDGYADEIAVEKPLNPSAKVKLSQGYTLAAELLPVPGNIGSKGNGSICKMTSRYLAQGSSENLKYKVVLFDKEGVFLSENNFSSKQAIEANAFPLPANAPYTLIVYAVDGTSKLPEITFTGGKTLASSQLLFDKTVDLTYFRKDLFVSNTARQVIHASLKHKFSALITTIDASQLGHPIKALTSSFNPDYGKVSFNLATGEIHRSGTASNTAIVFPALNTIAVTSVPTVINAEGAATFTISNFEAGPLKFKAVVGFDNFKIKPGVLYKLKLTLVSTDDRYLMYKDQAAARINGQIWMLGNVGSNATAQSLEMRNNDYVQLENILFQHGDYFQIGNSNAVANKIITRQNITDWIKTDNTSIWSTGTEEKPVKSKNDPCPTGYRVPTNTEFKALMANTLITNYGDIKSDPKNFNAGRLLVSKAKNEIKLFFPLQGLLGIESGEKDAPCAIASRGLLGYYWTSTLSNGDKVKVNWIRFSGNDHARFESVNLTDLSKDALNIRCIAE
ncbi:FISUMP domain-containing protein [Sphingobacterium sp. Mn56C]|uniref:FISUMP domain-containing protein n=1 Tax=Sphingobacterium sp. Mn56C TaxID=3395261 RepID=UPI003BD90B7F